MKISQELPNFDDEKALLVVTSKRVADFFVASKGVIKKLKSFEIPDTWVSGKEDFSERSGSGMVYGSGGLNESQKEKIRQKFLIELKKEIKQMIPKYKIESIYLFSPNYLINSIREALPNSAVKKIKGFLKGNYCSHHPFELLEKIKDKLIKEEKKAVFISPDAAKILKKSAKARKVIKGK